LRNKKKELYMNNTHIVDTTKSPGAALKSVPVENIKLSGGFWKERTDINSTNSLKDLWDLLAAPEAGHVLSNFRIAAGREEGEFTGTHWHDAWLYKWIEAAAVIYKLTGHEWIKEKMDLAIELIGAVQADDGYVATQTQARKNPRLKIPGNTKCILWAIFLPPRLPTSA
jgi:DUF1680 family protein